MCAYVKGETTIERAPEEILLHVQYNWPILQQKQQYKVLKPIKMKVNEAQFWLVYMRARLLHQHFIMRKRAAIL